MSTVGPAAIVRLASRLPDGAGLVDAPVLGSTAEAAAGQLILLVGGAAPTVERLRPLATLGEVVYVGPTGSGAAAKLMANAALLGSVALLGETLAIAALGLSRDTAWRVLARTPLAAQAERRRSSIDADSYPPRFALSLAAKDAGLIVREVGPADAPLAEGI